MGDKAFTIHQIKKLLAHNPLVAHIDTVSKGHIRIQTELLYPDGTSIDLFLEKRNDLLEIHKPKLTDFGGTWSWLQNLGFQSNKSVIKNFHSDRIMKLYCCSLKGAAIEHEVDTLDELPDGIARLGQACLQMAELIKSKHLCRRFRTAELSDEEFERIAASRMDPRHDHLDKLLDQE